MPMGAQGESEAATDTEKGHRWYRSTEKKVHGAHMREVRGISCCTLWSLLTCRTLPTIGDKIYILMRVVSLLHGANLRTQLCRHTHTPPFPSATLMGTKLQQVCLFCLQEGSVNLSLPQLKPLALERGAPTAS